MYQAEENRGSFPLLLYDKPPPALLGTSVADRSPMRVRGPRDLVTEEMDGFKKPRSVPYPSVDFNSWFTVPTRSPDPPLPATSLLRPPRSR